MIGSELGLLLALWVQGALALVLLGLLGRRRLPLIAAGKVHIRDIALSGENWPIPAQQASNAFDNQFQLPVLFYVVSFAVLYLTPNWIETVLAWLFVLSRIVHAFVHITSNDVVQRFSAYTVGYAILLAFWLDLAVRLVLMFR